MYGHAKGSDARPDSGLVRSAYHRLQSGRIGDRPRFDLRTRQMEEWVGEGHYPSGSYLPALAHGFAAFEAGDFNGTIEAPAPIVEESEHRRHPHSTI